jgi:hypothetical protein
MMDELMRVVKRLVGGLIEMTAGISSASEDI